jgi:hypothetical protein
MARGRELESSTAEGNSPVAEAMPQARRDPEYHGGTEEPRGKPGGPPSKAKHCRRPIAHSTVRER